MESAAKGWRTLNGFLLLEDVITGTVYVDGVKNRAA
jgi:hypothetical protein